MIVLLRNRTIWGISLILAGSLLLAGSVLLLCRPERSISVAGPVQCSEPVLIWDAGHGGADGGAVSAAGVPESGINLAIAGNCRDLCLFLGQDAVMTRRDNGSLADEDASSIRAQKVSDTKNRVALVNAYEDAVLFSIHQNSLPKAPKTHGAMVFCNGEDRADRLAETIQEALNGTVNTDNEKQYRPIGKDIYLMSHVHCPAVLIECGFMSNAAEAERLQDPGYQVLLACAVVCGYLQCKG